VHVLWHLRVHEYTSVDVSIVQCGGTKAVVGFIQYGLDSDVAGS